MKMYGKKLKEAREKMGLSQSELSTELLKRGVRTSRQSIILYESGHQEPKASRLKIICSVLGINMNDVVG